MTRKEFWLKLFAENDTALISAIILCERFVTLEQLESGEEYIRQRKKELYEKVPEDEIREIFPDYQSDKENVIAKPFSRCRLTQDVSVYCSDRSNSE